MVLLHLTSTTMICVHYNAMYLLANKTCEYKNMIEVACNTLSLVGLPPPRVGNSS